MNLDFSDEQRQLRSSVGSFLRDRYPFAARVRAAQSDHGIDPDIWQAFAHELGILGLCLPDVRDGFDNPAVETMIVMEELGSALVLEPYLETVVIAGGLLRRATNEASLAELDVIASGDAMTVVAWSEPGMSIDICDIQTRAVRDGDGWIIEGHKSVVTAARWASHFLVTARISDAPCDLEATAVFRIGRSAPGLTLRDYPAIDGRRAAEIELLRVRVSDGDMLDFTGGAAAALEQVMDEAIAAIAAEGLGIVRRMLQDTIDYTKQRKQFGKPLADFQVLQHRMVDMLMQVENAASAVYLATLSLDADPVERARATSVAKAAIGRACRFVGQNAVQLHGGMGFTEELPLGAYFRRAMAIESELGTVDDHVARFNALTRLAA